MLKALLSQWIARVSQMDASKAEQIKAHARAIAKLLYEETEETNPGCLETFEGIEHALRGHILTILGPRSGSFLSNSKWRHSRAQPYA